MKSIMIMTMTVVMMTTMTLASRHLPQWDIDVVLDDDNDDDNDEDDNDEDDNDTCIKAPTSMGGLMKAQV